MVEYNCHGKELITISRITNITKFLMVRSPGIMTGHINISRNPPPSQIEPGQSENVLHQPADWGGDTRTDWLWLAVINYLLSRGVSLRTGEAP